MTAARLRQLADREDAAALRALDAGDAELAREYRLLATLHREVAAAGELTTGERSPKVNKPEMVDSHRQAISEAHMPGSAAMKAARKAGMRTLADVARALGVSKGFVSQVLNGKKYMPPERAAEFQRLTGYPASRWPQG